MHYEEKIINGTLCHRQGPLEDWNQFSTIQLTNRISSLELNRKQDNEYIKDLQEVIIRKDRLIQDLSELQIQ